MKYLLGIVVTLIAAPVFVYSQNPAPAQPRTPVSSVVFVDHDKVAAALAKGGGLVSASDVLVSGSHREKPGQVEVHELHHAARREDRDIRDGEFETACQQVCPTEAISFGDLNNPESRASKARKDPRNYALLGELGTKPRTTYLAEMRNPNPEIATAAPTVRASRLLSATRGTGRRTAGGTRTLARPGSGR